MAESYRRSRWSNGLFVVPYLSVFLTLLVFPLGWGIWLSLNKVDLFGGERFIGLKNYARVLNDPIFAQAVKNTVIFVGVSVPTLVMLGLFLALALNKTTKGSSFLRGLFFASSILSVTIVTLIWRIVFIPNDGLMALIFEYFGWQPIGFLSTTGWSLFSVGVATVWWCIGLPMMLFLAALQQIPKDLYEAAALDNASRWRVLTRITLPSIKSTIMLVAVIQVVMQFQLFGQAQLMTNGGPAGSSRPIVMYIYEVGFLRWDIGMGAAASQILFLIILCAAMLQYWISTRKEEVDA
ncbi:MULTISPECIES: carbohydrate ABC transporter permease [Marinomonas]|jgi:multiple sugar transport system permease protein|uniref:Sugar ABC transporter permease n=1 Tax=Marinomonas arctica TaxID=383750 RepID=A0A7H1J225_9GAMM|nr:MULTISPECIES: sugar ABC transporter permease [Marinomonas]MCS7488214.1 ABC transporter permease [Marinomonas sp. BSi20414]QNT04541.1 sugar ABC transporter permease [Marinomonas arctica]GGN36887.1 sugar ABC transporter permease [Marinomonas arctica]